MANLAVKIYDHQKQRDGRWKFTPVGYHRNINGRETWRIRKLLELSLSKLSELPTETERNFARCVLLRTGQWALDCREDIPAVQEIRDQLAVFLEEMIVGARQFAAAASGSPDAHCLCRSAIGMEQEDSIKKAGAPALVITSPPYPGVHVLYHRWQVMGRRETPAPFWIAGTFDGAGASFYTFGDRKQKDLHKYYDQAGRAFSSLARIANGTRWWRGNVNLTRKCGLLKWNGYFLGLIGCRLGWRVLRSIFYFYLYLLGRAKLFIRWY